MKKKFKLISEDLQKNLIEFLDEIQFDAATDGDKESMHKINFCTWAITELMESYDAYVKSNDKDIKSRQDYVDETFMDWNLPEMDDEDYEKLVDQFDSFLKGWEKEYNKKNPQKKNKKQTRKDLKEDKFNRPHIEDINQYMSLDEIKEYLLDDEELTDEERFDLYYEEHKREERKKERRRLERGAKPIDNIMKELGLKYSDGSQTLHKKNQKK
tara:strand:+ start:253 stop:891 length:639 start_codon:yes stop_codon:yes gene_type:complete